MFYHQINIIYMILLKIACHWSARSGQEFLLSTLELRAYKMEGSILYTCRKRIIRWSIQPTRSQLWTQQEWIAVFPDLANQSKGKVYNGWHLCKVRVNRKQLLKLVILASHFIIITTYQNLLLLLFLSPSELFYFPICHKILITKLEKSAFHLTKW